MKTALFVNLPWWEQSGREIRMGVRSGSRWGHTFACNSRPSGFAFGDYRPYPIFLGYAASYVAKHSGWKVRFRDCIAMADSYQDFGAYLHGLSPDVVFIESTTPSWEHDRRMIPNIHRALPLAQLVICGTIVTTRAAEAMNLPGVAAVIEGEFEKGALAFLTKGTSGRVPRELLTLKEMNEAPFPYYDEGMARRYCDHNPTGQVFPHAQVWSSRGCAFKCLSGDTPVNTVEGNIPIKYLVGRESIGVFSFDPVTRRASVCTARHIRKTQAGARLMRVRFKDGSHLDCTPDHRFLAFKWGNQFVGEKQWMSEAANLKPGTHVRALRFNKSGDYIDVQWSRAGSAKAHRMVAEWKLGRSLTASENVHHIDRDKLNYRPDNLKVFQSGKEHLSVAHPEIAARMKACNPVKNMTPAWREKLAASRRGETLSEETRSKMAASALVREEFKTAEERSANARKGWGKKRLSGKFHRGGKRNAAGVFVANHVVESVEPLQGLHDTYCLEVADTGWFYANGVLVKNCRHCEWPATMTGNDPDGTARRTVRQYSEEYLEAFLRDLVDRFQFRSIYFDDDTMNLGNRHVAKVCRVMDRIGLPWSAMCRIDTCDREHWKLMRDAGCFGVKIGYESGSQYVVDQLINKGIDLKEAADTTHFLRGLGLTVHGTFMSGMPGETKDHMRQTLDYIASLPLTSVQHSGVAELEGAPLHTLREAGQMQDDNYTRENDGARAIERIVREMREET